MKKSFLGCPFCLNPYYIENSDGPWPRHICVACRKEFNTPKKWRRIELIRNKGEKNEIRREILK